MPWHVPGTPLLGANRAFEELGGVEILQLTQRLYRVGQGLKTYNLYTLYNLSAVYICGYIE